MALGWLATLKVAQLLAVDVTGMAKDEEHLQSGARSTAFRATCRLWQSGTASGTLSFILGAFCYGDSSSLVSSSSICWLFHASSILIRLTY
ncbi:hypothetical protein F5Y08DRAFT_257161 [Xylaria arbuscula]|nr:hypothetical protein F5Y08DRAFT_257161 [Xylaria arbuscula]